MLFDGGSKHLRFYKVNTHSTYYFPFLRTTFQSLKATACYSLVLPPNYANIAICPSFTGVISFIKLSQKHKVKLNLYISFNLFNSVFRSCLLMFFANFKRSILIKTSFVKVLFASVKVIDCKNCIVVSEFRSIKA